MNKFIKILLAFVLPILVLVILLEVLLRQIPNAYRVKSDYIELNADSIETLILGNSHTYYGVNPDYLSSNALNFANVSQTIDIDYKIIEDYAPKMPNLRFVIIRLSYDTLYEQLGLINENWRVKEYNIYTSMRLDYKIKHQFEITSVKLKTNINRIIEYYFDDDYVVNNSKRGWGIAPQFRKPHDIDLNGAKSAKRHTISDKYLYNENVDYLNKIIKYCANRDIKVLLLTPPAYKSYFQNLEKEQLESTINVGQAMDAKYNNCNYYNLLNSHKFTRIDFFDSDHLNPKGAEKFTKFINNEINSMKTVKDED